MYRFLLLVVATSLSYPLPVQPHNKFTFGNDTLNQDVSIEFDKILSDTRKRFSTLKNKWPITMEMFLKDIKYLTLQGSVLESTLIAYYRDLDTWRQLNTRLDYLYSYFKTGSTGDIKNQQFKKYQSPVIYKGQSYTVEQLGNINYGLAMKTMGIPYLASACMAGVYQILAEETLKGINYENVKKYLSALSKASRDQKLQGICLDHSNDSKMILRGYNW